MSGREKTALLEVLGESSELKVIDALVDNLVFNLTADEISDISSLGSAEVEEVLNKLESLNVVELECGEEGKKCYSLNTSSDAVCHLLHFEFELIEQELKEG